MDKPFQSEEGASRLSDAEPLFLIAPPRSGTTITAALLNAHPQILMTNETAVFIDLEERIRKSIAGAKMGVAYGKSFHTLWAEHISENAKWLIETYYEKIAEIESKQALRYWGDKHPHFLQCIEFVDQLYPQAKYIYLVRDPRDTICSLAKMRKIRIKQATKLWRIFVAVFEKFVLDTGPSRVITVRYEDLVGDYIAQTTRVLESLGLEMDDQVLEFINQNRDFDAHLKLTAIRKRFNFKTNSVGRWKKQLSSNEKRYTTRAAADYIKKYHYDQ